MSSSELVRGLQERAARALPAEQVKDVDGWRLRYAPRCGWWVGTVLPHGDVGQGDLVRRVVEAEEFYAGHGVAPRFQVCPGACPDGLDGVLAGRGYRRHGEMSLQAATVLEHPTAGPVRVRLDDRPTRAWFDVWHAVHGHGDARSERDMLDRVEPPSTYASALIGDDVVAVGRAVADTGWVGLFGMATLPEARGKGAARTVLAALADWGRAHEAGSVYLQVERDNAPALRLYGQAGFCELAAYHYRAAGRPRRG